MLFTAVIGVGYRGTFAAGHQIQQQLRLANRVLWHDCAGIGQIRVIHHKHMGKAALNTPRDLGDGWCTLLNATK